MSNKGEQIKNKIQGKKNKKSVEFHSIKSKFDLPTLLTLPFTSTTLALFTKTQITEDTVQTLFTAALMSFIARTGLMYYANSKRNAAPRRQLVSILNSIAISLVFSIIITIFCLLVKVSLKDKFLELVGCSLFISILGIYPAAFVVGTDIEAWTKMFSITEIFKCNRDEISVGAPLLGTIIGGWLSVLAIPLDWGQWWQPFPVSTILFTIIGNLVGSFIGILFYIFKKNTPSQTASPSSNIKENENKNK